MKNTTKHQRAINYLLKKPDAPMREVAKHSGLSVSTVHKIIKRRQTSLPVLKARKFTPRSWVPVSDVDIHEAAALVARLDAAEADIAKGPSAAVQMLLDAAHTFDEREATYGDAAEHWTEVAAVWSGVCGFPVAPETAVRMMIALKVMRLKTSPAHADTILDIAGYAAVLAAVVAKSKAE